MKQVLSCTRQELENANNLLVSRQKSLSDMESRLKSLESAFSHFFQNLPRSAKDYVEGYVSFGTTGETDYAKALQLLRKVIDESLTSSALKK
jgi:nitrate reductase assembly molybdenum cofactor insertion protein NarJ